jgi:hypothetical protein
MRRGRGRDGPAALLDGADDRVGLPGELSLGPEGVVLETNGNKGKASGGLRNS